MVQLLLKKTERGELDWKGSAVDDTVQLSFGNYALVFRQTPGRNHEAYDYRIQVLNENGDVADEFTDDALIQEFNNRAIDDSQRPYVVVHKLYEMARRYALGTDKILDSILMELDDEIPF